MVSSVQNRQSIHQFWSWGKFLLCSFDPVVWFFVFRCEGHSKFNIHKSQRESPPVSDEQLWQMVFEQFTNSSAGNWYASYLFYFWDLASLIIHAIAITGVNQGDHYQFFDTFTNELRENHYVAVIQGRNCLTLKWAINTMAFGLIGQSIGENVCANRLGVKQLRANSWRETKNF